MKIVNDSGYVRLVTSGNPPTHAVIGDILVDNDHNILIYNGRNWEKLGSSRNINIIEDTTPLNIKIKRIFG